MRVRLFENADAAHDYAKESHFAYERTATDYDHGYDVESWQGYGARVELHVEYDGYEALCIDDECPCVERTRAKCGRDHLVVIRSWVLVVWDTIDENDPAPWGSRDYYRESFWDIDEALTLFRELRDGFRDREIRKGKDPYKCYNTPDDAKRVGEYELTWRDSLIA